MSSSPAETEKAKAAEAAAAETVDRGRCSGDRGSGRGSGSSGWREARSEWREGGRRRRKALLKGPKALRARAFELCEGLVAAGAGS